MTSAALLMHRVFTVVAIVSTVLWFAVVVSWAAGHGAFDDWWVTRVDTSPSGTADQTRWSIWSTNGTLTLSRTRVEARFSRDNRTWLGPGPLRHVLPDGPHWFHLRRFTSKAPVSPSGQRAQARWWSGRFEVRPARRPIPVAGGSEWHDTVSCPHWALAVALSLVPIAWGTRQALGGRRTPR